jgi:hypothetical protein
MGKWSFSALIVQNRTICRFRNNSISHFSMGFGRENGNSFGGQWQFGLCGIDSSIQINKLWVPVIPRLAISGIRF